MLLGCTWRLLPTERCLPASANWRRVHGWIGDQDAQHGGQLSVENLLAVRPQIIKIQKDLLDPSYIFRRAFDLDRS